MVVSPDPYRHEHDNSIHATFLYTTARLHPFSMQLPAVQEDKAVIDLSPKEACTGLTFVCLSRAKRLVDLIVELMSFDRIGNLGNLSTMKARLQEEVRLADLAQSTTVRYTEMGALSAVAGGN